MKALFVLMLLLVCQSMVLTSYAIPSLTGGGDTQVESVQQPTGPAFLLPIRKAFVKWSMVVNREVPKYMGKLKKDPSPAVILSALFMAFMYGVVHTLGPGHGKMVVGTYFLTRGGHFWRGALVGAQVAFSHVIGAVVIVFVTDVALRQILTHPQDQFLWVRAISFGLIILIGIFMLVQALRHAFGAEHVHTCSHCSHHDHGHGHDHAHDHHKHDTGATVRETGLSWAVGLVPCTGSLLILLYAMAHDILILGLLMVFCVAVGMACAMTGIGVLALLGKQHVVDRFSKDSTHGHKWQIGLEVLGAIFIILIGSFFLWAV